MRYLNSCEGIININKNKGKGKRVGIRRVAK